ncbi:polysaccharide biosynthesis/export family protein [Marinomonas transparens]|uniref:Polysaccharide export protein n=1 Tax=Marinomonas transparens TaxID=2795388 RepID=A0A934N1U9_9GAMM|nr:polysaccharide biosynthesis/export family protein [Marinomonas transparens]MBJ7538117.1 polysaccharide export protein [Marinomonas transparens]
MTKLLKCILLFSISMGIYAQGSYILKAGDIIEIHVYNENNLDLTTKIDSSGIINFPFIGEVKTLNKSTKEVSKNISSRLRNGYFVNPEVHVSIVEYRPFYINGQVKKPGGFPYQPNITVSMGIALAGGLTDRASKSNWFIKKPSNKKYKVTGESFLFPGDILIIDQSFF